MFITFFVCRAKNNSTELQEVSIIFFQGEVEKMCIRVSLVTAPSLNLIVRKLCTNILFVGEPKQSELITGYCCS